MTRYAKRRDANEPELVAAARKMGMKVFYTNELGDLLVQYAGLTSLWEIKTSTGKLTDAQCRRKQQGLEARIIRNLDDVILARSEMTRDAGAIQRTKMGD